MEPKIEYLKSQQKKNRHLKNMGCFRPRHKNSFGRGRVWERWYWQSRVEQQSEPPLHKATVEAGLALKPELLREEANTKIPPLPVTVSDLLKECRK